MRDYKFRVWDNVDYMSSSFTMHDMQKGFVQFTSDCIVMEFVGLYDDNDKEIYESDIIQDSSGNLLFIEWNDDTCKMQYNDGSDINAGENYGTYKLVVGNIYESPNLLK